MPESSQEAAPAAPAAETNTDVAAPAPSTGEQGVETTLIERVTAALDGGKAESPAASDGKENVSPPVPATETKTDDDDPSADPAWKTYPHNVQGRIRQLVDQKNEALRQTRETTAQIERLTEAAKFSEQLADFMEQKGIEPKELDNTLALTALIKSRDYKGALKILDPIYRELHNRVGNVLPADLEQKVKQGVITRADALALNQARAEAKNLETQTTEERQRIAQAAERTAWDQRVKSASSTVSKWDEGKAKSDPDWSLKQPLLAAEIELELRRSGRDGYPKTPEEAVAIAEKALKTVTARMKSFQPVPQSRTTPVGDSTSPRSKAKPTSLMDAINQALAPV